MRTVRGLVSKVGFTAIGIGAGLILAAGTGVAAVHMTQTAAGEHSIDAVQAIASPDDRVHPEDSSTSGTDDVAGASQSNEATESAEPSEPADDSSSKSASTDSSGDRSGQGSDSSSRSPEPGDDHGRDGTH